MIHGWLTGWMALVYFHFKGPAWRELMSILYQYLWKMASRETVFSYVICWNEDYSGRCCFPTLSFDYEWFMWCLTSYQWRSVIALVVKLLEVAIKDALLYTHTCKGLNYMLEWMHILYLSVIEVVINSIMLLKIICWCWSVTLFLKTKVLLL